MLVLLDTLNREWDTLISSFILDQACRGAGQAGPSNVSGIDDSRTEDGRSVASQRSAATSVRSRMEEKQELWSFQKLKAYFSYVKDQFSPELSPEASEVLSK